VEFLYAGYTAEEKDGVILVNGEKIHLNCEIKKSNPRDIHMEYTDVTTDVARVAGHGRRIVYRGSLREQKDICVGDIQGCTCHNLQVIMNSLGMIRTYPELSLTTDPKQDQLEEWI